MARELIDLLRAEVRETPRRAETGRRSIPRGLAAIVVDLVLELAASSAPAAHGGEVEEAARGTTWEPGVLGCKSRVAFAW